MNQTFISLQFDKIKKRFNEIDTLLTLAEKHQHSTDIYQSLCRSAHVLLVSHFEGIYKDITKDIIDDINNNIKYFEVKNKIFNTFCSYFILNSESEKSSQQIRLRLKDILEHHPAQIKSDPFLFVDNKNPTPKIIETILSRFGIDNFFLAITNSNLDIVFEDQRSSIIRLRNQLYRYTIRNTYQYPYCVTPNYYNPNTKPKTKTTKTLWEDFLNDFLKERHNIVHGHTLGNNNNHESISRAKIKIEILILVFIINICSAANPLFIISE